MASTVFELSAATNKGAEQPLSAYAGKAVVVVNTASKCGFTPQYAGLEALYKKYKDKCQVVLGFPCDQFGHQEPGNDAEIAQFCRLNFGVSFPLMSKVKVNGPGAHPVFALLKKQAPGMIGRSIKWNFTKFLVSKDGKKVKRYAPDDAPEAMEAEILAALNA